jgi:hypothetical protein
LNSLGSIEDKGDLDLFGDDPDSLYDNVSLSGTSIYYNIELETTGGVYSILYTNKNCTVNFDAADYTVSGSELTINFDLESADESLVTISGNTMEIEMTGLVDLKFYMDIAFEPFIIAEAEGKTGEPIDFEVVIGDDLLELNTDYSFEWDFDDGSGKTTGQSVTHTFQYTGTYDVDVIVTDSSGYSTTSSTQIEITQGSSSGNGNNGGTNGGSSGDNSGFLLFMGIIVVIVIIGVIALIFIIRR